MDYLEKLSGLYNELEIKPFCEVKDPIEYMVQMSDGINLRTVVFLPKGREHVPVVLQRTCYPQNEAICNLHAAEYCRRGFGFVVQWCRGINGSEGEWEPNVYDRQDGLDTVNWLSDMPFCDSIGYWGDSYLAYTGWCMADSVPEKVRTMYLGVYGCLRHTSAYKDGLFRQDILTAWAMGNAGRKIEADYLESCRFRPQAEVDEKLWGLRLNWYRDWITHTDRADEYWKEGLWGRLAEVPAKLKIPVYIREGWYDHHLGSALESCERLSEFAAAHSTIQIGPWNHGYGKAVTKNTDKLVDDSVSAPFEWFTRILVNNELPEAKTAMYCIGADSWIYADGYPLKPESEKKYYLSALENRKSIEREPVSDSSVSFVYDPENPVMSHGAESLFATQSEVGSILQPEPDYRSDVVSFVSGPLAEDITCAGKIKVKLFVSSDAADTAFTAKLMETDAEGNTVNVRGTITTLAFRNGADIRQKYTPGEIVPVTLEMWDIAWLFKKGVRLRLDISSSDFPQYSVHPNAEGIWSLQEKTKKAHQTIYCGEKYPSEISLPMYI